MKKIVVTIIGVIVLVLGALAGLPYWFGMETEKTYNNMIERLSKSGGIQLSSKRFERGWLSSTAETVIRYPGLPIEFNALHKISHGPIPLDRLLEGAIHYTPVQALIKSRITVVVLGNDQSEPSALFSRLPSLTANTTIGLGGDGTVHVDLPGAKKTAPDGGTFEWRGMTGDLTFDKEWKKLKANLRIPSISFTGAPGKGLAGGLSLSNLTVHSDLHEGIAGYFFGENSVTIEKLELGPAISLRGLRFSTTTRPSGDNVNMVITYKMKEVGVANNRYGPAQLTLEARKLDAAALGKFEKEVNAIYRKNLPEEQASLMVLGKTLELVANLSKKAPEIEITKLSFKSNQGEVTGKAKFILDGSKANVNENPMLLLTALRGKAELVFPPGMLKPLLAPLIQRDIETFQKTGKLTAKETAKLNPETMGKIIDQALPLYLSKNKLTKLLVRDGDKYKITASIKHGQLLVNDKPWRGPLVKLP